MRFAALFLSVALMFGSISKKVVVIDAGHGGWDPGKVGINNAEEAAINLQIAEYLQMYLQLGGAMAFLTRADDIALADRKNADLAARSAMPTDLLADIFISIHQNAFNSPDVKGAQVFYYEGSDEGARLAEAIQDSLAANLSNSGKKPKGGTSYYLLENSKTPAIIIECGFLTNHDEAQKLTTSEYQQQVAWAIYIGLMNYFSA